MASNSVRILKNDNFHWVGNGFPVRSIFGYNDLGKELSPFLLLDYAAPYEFSASSTERRGVGAHPHRGFETVTLAYQGEIEHRDSSGGGGKIGPGDVQWMTAAKGLIHDEFHSKEFTGKGGIFEMVQLWINLPAKFKSAEPNYQTILNNSIPKITLADNAGEIRIIAGEFEGQKGPAKTFTEINLWDLNFIAGKAISLNIKAGDTKAFLVLRGELEASGQLANKNDLIIFDRAETTVSFEAKSDTKLLTLIGEPIQENVVGYGPFVMNTKAEIIQAFKDFERGDFGNLG